MLELILTRVRDRALVERAQGLRFLVLDELHTYRGRQGADVALLVRRLREACRSPDLRYVGTSATLSTEGSLGDQQRAVAAMATTIFGSPVTPASVVGETLRRATPELDFSDAGTVAQLRRRLAEGSGATPRNYHDLVADPLSSWIEQAFGVHQLEGRLDVGRRTVLDQGDGESESPDVVPGSDAGAAAGGDDAEDDAEDDAARNRRQLGEMARVADALGGDADAKVRGPQADWAPRCSPTRWCATSPPHPGRSSRKCSTRCAAWPTSTASSIPIWSSPTCSPCLPTVRRPTTPRPAGAAASRWCWANPPWERVKLQEKEWFAVRAPEVATAPNAAARKRLIKALIEDDLDLHLAFLDAVRQAEGESHLLRSSARFPLCGRGDVNTYTVFAEAMRSAISPVGLVGVIVSSGIATDDTTKHFFADLVERRSLVSLYDFENRAGIFPAVDSRLKFCLLTLAGAERPAGAAEFVFFAHATADLAEPERRFTLSADDFALLNPNTRTCPMFRSRRDAELTKAIYRRVPALIDHGPPEGNPWGVTFQRMFDMSNDSSLFRTRAQLEADGWTLAGNVFTRGPDHYLPLYEAKMLHHFDHRWATYDGLITRDLTTAEKADPTTIALPRYWVPEKEVDSRRRYA